jgi:integrase
MASIRKRSWKSRGVERTSWVVDYADQSGARRLKTFATKKEADAWAVTALHEVKQGVHTPASTSITVAEAWERWITNCEAEGLEFGTIKQRRQHLNLHVAPIIGRDRLSSLTTPRVHQFDADMRAGGRSIAMRRKVLTNLKTLLTFCQGQGLVAQNVARGVKIKSDDRRNASGPLREGQDFPSKAEIRELIDKASDRRRPFLLTAIFTGMRASELRGLRWEDVDFEAGIIHVRQRADAWRNIGPPKSAAGSRDIPLTPMVINALRQWKPACPAGPLGLVFPNGSGNIESHTNIVKRLWHPLQVKAGVAIDTGKVDADGKPILRAKYGFHALRHVAASLFIAHLGWTPKRVQSVMGHSSITMTFDRYGHLFEDHDGDKEAMKKLEAAIVAA